MPKPTEPPLPDWERVLSSAARLQRILPDAVLVGGTASAIHAAHRFSRDADHVLTDLRSRFDAVLQELESVAGWKTARIQRPVQILGSLDGIETGVRQLIRDEPLETTVMAYHGERITLPSEAEILRIKGLLILKRNATRDYLDFIALADHLGDEHMSLALQPFDRLYQQPNGLRVYAKAARPTKPQRCGQFVGIWCGMHPLVASLPHVLLKTNVYPPTFGRKRQRRGAKACSSATIRPAQSGHPAWVCLI
jgi:hypothetical protein